jgi:hypothetical protein
VQVLISGESSRWAYCRNVEGPKRAAALGLRWRMNVRFLLVVLAACSGETTAPSIEELPIVSPQVGIEPSSEVVLAPPPEAAVLSPEPPSGEDKPGESVGASDEERAAAAALAAALMEEAAEVTGVPQNEVDGILQGITNSAPTATDEDRQASPRSARPGRPDVASSCNTIAFASECMETARTATGQGYRSTQAMCVNGIWSTTDPCPGAGRTGTCRITEDQQVVHYYYAPSDRDPDPMVRARRVCESYSGEFFAARTHPLNGR